MPELPDVENFKNYFNSTALNQKIIGVEVNHKRVLEGVSSGKLQENLVSKRFETAKRHGKYLFAFTSGGLVLVLHFGMTGFLEYFKGSSGDGEHRRVIFSFEDGYRLAYINQRLLGKVGLSESMDGYIREKDLGPDAVDIDFETFRGIISSKKSMLKSTLMNQSLIAGVGNIYSDEILFQAGLHPKIKSNRLSEKQIEKLYKKTKEVIDTAIKAGAEAESFPESWLIPRRNKEESCPKCGGNIKKIKVSGRSAYWCPNEQKKVS